MKQAKRCLMTDMSGSPNQFTKYRLGKKESRSAATLCKDAAAQADLRDEVFHHWSRADHDGGVRNVGFRVRERRDLSNLWEERTT